MTEDKTQHHVIFACTILLALFFGLTFYAVSIVQANAGPDSTTSSATFRTVQTEAAQRLERA